MQELLLVLYVLVALGLVGLILIQHGKGADMGASFGSGSSNTVFGSSGSGNFLTRMTGLLATAFMVLSLVLGFMASRQVNDPYQIDVDVKVPVVNNPAPVTPAGPAATAAVPVSTEAAADKPVATPAAVEPVEAKPAAPVEAAQPAAKQ